MQNVEDLTKKLTTTLTVQLETPECVEYLSKSKGFFDEMLLSWGGLGKPLSMLDETLSLQRHADAAWERMKIEMKEEAKKEKEGTAIEEESEGADELVLEIES